MGWWLLLLVPGIPFAGLVFALLYERFCEHEWVFTASRPQPPRPLHWYPNLGVVPESRSSVTFEMPVCRKCKKKATVDDDFDFPPVAKKGSEVN